MSNGISKARDAQIATLAAQIAALNNFTYIMFESMPREDRMEIVGRMDQAIANADGLANAETLVKELRLISENLKKIISALDSPSATD